MQKTVAKKRGAAPKKPTLQDVADAVGVHSSTVSRALDPSARHLISPDLVARINAARQALGYRPISEALVLGPTQTIGVIIPDITNPIFPPIIRGIEDTMLNFGFLTTVANTDGSLEREASVVNRLLRQKADGLIVASSTREDPAMAEAMARNVPLIAINRRVEGADIPYVVNDDANGIRRVVTHLMSLGHRKLAWISGPMSLSTGKRRHDAFVACAQENDVALVEKNMALASRYAVAEGERCMEQLLVNDSCFTAVVCANDQLAVGALATIRRAGLRCPDDISVTGFNDMPLADQLDPPLTTVRIRQYQAGRIAAEMMFHQLSLRAGQDVVGKHGRSVILPVELVVRKSSGFPKT